MKRILITAAAAAAALAGSAAVAAPAMASNGNGVTAVTHSAQHNDTTSGPVNPAVGSLQSSPNGPVWAIDNLTEKFSVVPTGTNNYAVTIDVNGSFKGFADPGANGLTVDNHGQPIGNYGQPLASSGPMKGTIEYDVYSATAPDPAALLPNQAPDTGLGVAIGQLFGETDGLSIFNPAHVGPTYTGGGNYTFSYQNGNYVQDTNGITGDVTGH